MRFFGKRAADPSAGRRAFLHIGLPKTATTTIQNVLHAHREELLASRILYPSLRPNLSGVLCTNFMSDPLRHISHRMAGRTREEAVELGRAELSDIEAELAGTDWRTLLLSAEGISNLQPAELQQLHDWLRGHVEEIGVLACVRHPVKHTTSVMQQLMKNGATLEGLYENPPLPRYRKKLGNMIDTFGREQVQVISFEDAVAAEGGIVAEFAQRVGLGAEDARSLASRSSRDNESLSDLGVAVLDSLNHQRPMFLDGRRNPARSAQELPYIARLAGQRFSLPPEVANNIRDLCADDVVWVKETFGLDLYREAGGPRAGRAVADTRIAPDVAASIAAVIGDLVNNPRGKKARPAPKP